MSSNVKTVKKKRSTNVPQTFRHLTENETKIFEFVFKSGPSKEHISIYSRRADSGPNQNNLFSTRQIRERFQNVLVSISKRFGFVFKTISERFSFSFWHYYRWDVQNIIAFAKSAGFRAKPFIATPTSEPRVYKGKRQSSPASASRAATESAASQSKISAFVHALNSLTHIQDLNSNESKSPTSSSLTSPHPSTTSRSPLSWSRMPRGRVL